MPDNRQQLSRGRQATPSGTITPFSLWAAQAIRFGRPRGDSVFSARDREDQSTPRP